MDLEPHVAWSSLTDPQGKANLPDGSRTGGSLVLEMKFVQW